MCKVLQEPSLEPVRRQVTVTIEPAPIRWDAIGRIESQAAEHVRGDLGAFLRRLRVQRVQAAKLRREQLENTQLPRDLPDRVVRPARRVRIDRLPDSRGL